MSRLITRNLSECGLPSAFVDEVFTPAQMAAEMGIDEDELFRRLRCGFVVPPVWLDSIDPPVPVWLRDLVGPWIANGSPVSVLVSAHSHTVLSLLNDSVAAEQITRN